MSEVMLDYLLLRGFKITFSPLKNTLEETSVGSGLAG
jgi:hypothetical protein